MDREEPADILHPLTSLECRECRRPPADIYNAHMVCLRGKVYVGEGEGWSRARLYIYSPAADTWDTMVTPMYNFALTVYHSQLVLVGVWEYVGWDFSGSPSSRVWTLGEDGHRQKTFPPIETCGLETSAVSHGDHLFVIDDQKVHIYNGHNWARVQHSMFSPPIMSRISSTVIDGDLHIMREREVHYISLDSLLASCQPSDTPQSPSVWKRLPDAPEGSLYLTKFGTRLVVVGESAIYAFSPTTQSWVHVKSDPFMLQRCPCAVALSSNELMFVEGPLAHRITIKGTAGIRALGQSSDPQHDFCGLM